MNNRFFSCAIFSQNNEKTKIDFRNYDSNNPNRTPPINLPEDLKKKIKSFMSDISLNCGSLDLIYSKSKKFYFLEVNPDGQFSQVSIPCNFNIEREIAALLSQE